MCRLYRVYFKPHKMETAVAMTVDGIEKSNCYRYSFEISVCGDYTECTLNYIKWRRQ